VTLTVVSGENKRFYVDLLQRKKKGGRENTRKHKRGAASEKRSARALKPFQPKGDGMDAGHPLKREGV